MHKILEERRKAMLRVMLVGVIIAVSIALSRDLFGHGKFREFHRDTYDKPMDMVGFRAAALKALPV